MNKRSAMMVAAGLVLAMLVAGMAVAAGFTGPEASANGSSSANGELQRREPKVRTITETVTIHRDAKPSDDDAPSPVVVTETPSGAPTVAPAGDDDSYEHEDEGEDDEYEHEDGEDDDSYEHEDGDEDEDEHEDD